jgi:hypothetical protein
MASAGGGGSVPVDDVVAAFELSPIGDVDGGVEVEGIDDPLPPGAVIWNASAGVVQMANNATAELNTTRVIKRVLAVSIFAKYQRSLT